MSTRSICFDLTPEEYEALLDMIRASGDVRFLAGCVDSLPAPDFDDPRAVVDARGPGYAGTAYAWNRSICPPPEYRECPADDNAFGKRVYFLNSTFCDVAELSGSVLTTGDLRSKEFMRWFARLRKWISARTWFDRNDRRWVSREYLRAQLASEHPPYQMWKFAADRCADGRVPPWLRQRVNALRDQFAPADRIAKLRNVSLAVKPARIDATLAAAPRPLHLLGRSNDEPAARLCTHPEQMFDPRVDANLRAGFGDALPDPDPYAEGLLIWNPDLMPEPRFGEVVIHGDSPLRYWNPIADDNSWLLEISTTRLRLHATPDAVDAENRARLTQLVEWVEALLARLSDPPPKSLRPDGASGNKRLTYAESYALVQPDGEPKPRVRRRPAYHDNATGPALFRTYRGGEDLARISLPGLYIGRSELVDIRLAHSKLYRSVFNWSDFQNVDFSHSDLHDSDLRACIFRNCSFAHADLQQCDLRGSTFESCDFGAAKLAGALLLAEARDQLELSPPQQASVTWCDEYDEPAPA